MLKKTSKNQLFFASLAFTLMFSLFDDVKIVFLLLMYREINAYYDFSTNAEKMTVRLCTGIAYDQIFLYLQGIC